MDVVKKVIAENFKLKQACTGFRNIANKAMAMADSAHKNAVLIGAENEGLRNKIKDLESQLVELNKMLEQKNGGTEK